MSKNRTTETVEPTKPLIVQERVRPSTLFGQGEFLNTLTENLNRAVARDDESRARLLGLPYTPTVDEGGKTIATNTGFKPFDTTVFFEASKNPYLAADIEQNKEERMRERRRKREEKMNEVDMIFNMPRANYLAAMNRAANQGRSS
jgi:hypothetical protein